MPKLSNVCLLCCELQFVAVRLECGRKRVRVLKPAVNQINDIGAFSKCLMTVTPALCKLFFLQSSASTS